MNDAAAQPAEQQQQQQQLQVLQPQPQAQPQQAAAARQQQLQQQQQQQQQQEATTDQPPAPQQEKPWELYRHPADRLVVRIAHAYEKAKRKGYFKHPLRAIKDRRKHKKEKKRNEYRNRLQTLLEEYGWPLPAEHHEEIAQLLRKKPFLAGHVFTESISGHSTSPLSFLIAGGAPVDLVKEVYHMSTEAIYRVWPEDTYPPLMGACHSGSDHDVISFLVSEFPGALYKKDFDGSLPINIYMRRSPNGPSFDVISKMVDLYPESIIVDDRIGWGLSPIDYALRLDFDIRILELFVQRWPKEENDYGLFWDGASDLYPDAISMERIQVLMTLLPQLDYFHSFIDEWSADGLIYVMDQLRNNDTVVDLCLRVPVRTIVGDERVVESLVKLLRENKRIEKLTLLGTRNQMRNGFKDDAYFGKILEALQSNTNLHEVNLSDFSLDDGSALAEYFLSGQAPRIFTLTDIFVGDAWKPYRGKPRACRTEKLTISYCNIYTPWYQGFLNQLQGIDSIKEFVLHNGTSLNLNVTTLLFDMISHSPVMSIKVTGYQVHIRRIAEALKTNKHLIKYSAEASVNLEWKRALVADVMEEHNTTLEWVDLPDPKSRNGEQGQRLAYFSLLNQYGRKKIRTMTSAKDFTNVLVDVNEDTATLQDIAQVNIIYGLLQEVPDLWSGLNFSVDAAVEKEDKDEKPKVVESVKEEEKKKMEEQQQQSTSLTAVIDYPEEVATTIDV